MTDEPSEGAGDADGGRGTDDVDYASFVAVAADLTAVKSIDGRFRYVSPASRRLFGWQPADLEGELEDDYVHPDDLHAVRSARRALPDAEYLTLRHRMRCRDNSYRWVEVSSHHVQADGTWLVVSTLRDITERLEHEDDLQFRARTDPLTGVGNRTVLMDRIQQALRRLERGQGGTAVLYADVDRFKVFNDSLGHHIGDQIIIGVAERIAHHLRPPDTLARLGGDEFVVVAEDLADHREAVELGNRIAGSVRTGIQVHDEVYECTLSVGVAWTTDPQRGAANLLHDADLALYRAKDRGRDRVEVFDEELRASAASRLTTERMLRQALEENRVVVEYQPIIDLGTAEPTGAEALVRIRDADTDRLVLPDAFLAVADEAGLLRDIDDVVLATAVGQAADWHARFAGTGFGEVAVNVTARHLADSRFPSSVVELLHRIGVPPQMLQIELTERTLIEASNSAVSALRSLRQAGIQVGLDDFGTGYSSLSYLRQFPLDFVKIDRSFIHDLDVGPTEQAIVGAVIGLAHALDLRVVAEGVETETQRHILEDFECDRAQGFLFARPADAERLTADVAASKNRP